VALGSPVVELVEGRVVDVGLDVLVAEQFLKRLGDALAVLDDIDPAAVCLESWAALFDICECRKCADGCYRAVGS